MKNGFKRWNFGLWGADHGPWIFFWFFGKVSEQSDQVAQKPDFLLRTGNNDPKQKDKS